MTKHYYRVKLKRNINEKTVSISATSEANAGYEATRQNAGWTVVDIQRA